MYSRTFVSTRCAPLCQEAFVFPVPWEWFSWIWKTTSERQDRAVSWSGTNGTPSLCCVPTRFSCSSLLGMNPGNHTPCTHFIGGQSILTPSPALACFEIKVYPFLSHALQVAEFEQKSGLWVPVSVAGSVLRGFALGSDCHGSWWHWCTSIVYCEPWESPV